MMPLPDGRRRRVFISRPATTWAAINPVLRFGELAIESDTGKVKKGNGATAWNSLDYWGEGMGGSVWGTITGALSDQTDLDSALDGKAGVTHGHSESDVSNLVTDLAGKAPTSHGHSESDVTGLVTDLAGKAATSHTHGQGDVTDLITDLGNKVPSTRKITASIDLSADRNLTYSDVGADASGAAAAVQGNLNTHSGLTTTAHGGIVADTDARLTDARTPTQHAINSATLHSSTATSGQMLKADANGLPVNATNTDAQVASAVTNSHALHSDDQTLEGLGGVPTSRTLTINGDAKDLSADRSWTVTSAAADLDNAPSSNQTIASGQFRYIVDYYEIGNGLYTDLVGIMEIG